MYWNGVVRYKGVGDKFIGNRSQSETGHVVLYEPLYAFLLLL